MNSAAEIQTYIDQIKNVVVLFGTATCPPCQAVKPKVIQMVEQEFPELKFFYVDCATVPEVAGHFGILSVPTLALYIDGELVKQFVKTFSINEVREAIERPYKILFL